MEKRNLPNKIKEISKQVITSSFKVQLALLGPVGTAIDEVLFGIGERTRAKRLESFVEFLAQQVSILEENKIDMNFFKSEEFHDILILTATQSTRTRHKEKIEAFSRILAGSFSPEQDVESLEDITQIVAALTLRDILVIREIQVLNKEIQTLLSGSEKVDLMDQVFGAKKISSSINLLESDVNFSLTRLLSLGLIKEYYVSQFGGSSGGHYFVTDKFYDLVKFITVQ